LDAISSIFSTPVDSPLTPRFLGDGHGSAVRIPVRKVVEGYYWLVSFVLPFGDVIHDYLEHGPA